LSRSDSKPRFNSQTVKATDMSDHKHMFDSCEGTEINGRIISIVKMDYVFEGAKCKICDTLICGKFLDEAASKTKYRCTLAEGHNGKCENTHVGVVAP
jgi:hypothetical protein